MITKKGYTRGELSRICDCPYFVIDYLRNTNQLKFIKGPGGKGSTAIYHPDAIQIVRNHLARGNTNDV